VVAIIRRGLNDRHFRDTDGDEMKTAIVVVVLLCGLTVGQQSRQATPYVIVAHKGYDYTVRHGRVVMKVTYAQSQTSSAKRGDDSPGAGLHLHTRNGEYPHGPDLSQVPEVGVSVRQCLLSTPDKDGDPVIAIQPTPDPCMTQNGNTLRYEPSPNGPSAFTYVNFDIVSERLETK
jgi:hypothetical protein